MKRYCMNIDCAREGFLQNDRRGYNYEKDGAYLKEILQKESQNLQNIVNENYFNRNKNWGRSECFEELAFLVYSESSQYIRATNFISVLNSRSCRFDILNEIYLLIKSMEDGEEFLFTEIENTGIDGGTSPAENYIKNLKQKLKRGCGSKEIPLIFDVSEILTTSKKKKISSFAVGLLRLWLNVDEFRTLFFRTDEASPRKHTIENIYGCIEKGESLGIKYQDDDYIILEKLLGINTGIFFAYYIIGQMHGLNYGCLEPLLDSLMKCKGEFSRCLFIKYIGDELRCLINSHEKYDEEECVWHFTKDIEDMLPYYNSIYERTAEMYLRRHMEFFSRQTIKEAVGIERNAIQQEAKYAGYGIQCLAQMETEKEAVENIPELRKTLKGWGQIPRAMIMGSGECPGYLNLGIKAQGRDRLEREVWKKIIDRNYDKYNGS